MSPRYVLVRAARLNPPIPSEEASFGEPANRTAKFLRNSERKTLPQVSTLRVNCCFMSHIEMVCFGHN